MAIKVIAFDLGGVYFTDGTEVALKKIYGLVDAPREKIDELFRAGPRREGWLYRKGKMTKDDFWNAVAEKLNITMNKTLEMRKIWLLSYTPIRGMKELVSKLRKNHKIVVFSATAKERMDYVEKTYGVYDNFDDFVLSFETGFHKNEREAYEILLQKIQCKPEECIIVDDKQAVIDIARTFGIKTILFRSIGQLKAELRKLDVL